MQREIQSQLQDKGVGTKAQQALKLQHEQCKLDVKPRARRTDAEPIIRKVNSLVIIGLFISIYDESLPRPMGKKKTVAGQVDFVRLLYILWRRF